MLPSHSPYLCKSDPTLGSGGGGGGGGGGLGSAIGENDTHTALFSRKVLSLES